MQPVELSEQDISDLELGRTIRASSDEFVDATTDEVQVAYIAVLALVRLCVKFGGAETTMSLGKVHREGVRLGDWKVSVRRVRAPKEEKAVAP